MLNGELLLSASNDKTIILWDIKSRKMLRSYIGHKSAVKYISLHSGTDY